MNRYKKTFEQLKKERRIGFCPFAVLGDPSQKGCMSRIEKYLEISPDFIELGIPFSDPIADGPIIQAADERALASGMTPMKAIKLVKEIRVLIKKTGRETPIGILTYSNIVLQYGIENFYKDLCAAGADSVLIADVPLEEAKPFVSMSKKHKVQQIFLVSEYTDGKRLRSIEKNSGGFLYVVSALGTTGVRKNLDKNIEDLVRKLKKQTQMPLVVGFGISSKEHISKLRNAGANGAIVGSLLVNTQIKKLVKTLKSLV